MRARASKTAGTRNSQSLFLSLIILSSGLVSAAVLLGVAPQTALAVPGLGLLALAVSLFRGRLAPLYMSPVFVASFSLLMMGLLGAAFYRSVQDAPTGGSAYIVLTQWETFATLQVILVAAGCIFVGGLAAVYSMPPIERAAVREEFYLSDQALRWLLFGCLLPLAATLVLSGPATFRRDYYIEQAVNDAGVLGIADQLSVVAVIALGFLLGRLRNGGAMWWVSAVTSFGYLVIFFGTGSRKLAMWPLLLALGLLVDRRSKGHVLLFATCVPISFYLIRVSLYLRGLPEQGVIPYLDAMGGLQNYSAGWDSIAKNILISFGIIGATAFHVDPLGSDTFWVAVNPTPGQSAGWYDIAQDMRINSYTPYAGVGELANSGTGYLVGYFLVVGLVLGVLDHQVQRLLRKGLPYLGLATVGLTGLFVLYIVQYNLRSATRMLLYAMLLGFAVEIILRLKVRVVVQHQG